MNTETYVLPGVLLGLLVVPASAQKASFLPEREGFVATFGGDGTDVATCVAAGRRRDTFVAGWTDSFGAGSHDAWVARLGPKGDARWERALGGTDRDEVHDLLVTADGGCLLVGSTWSFGAGQADGWIVKLSAAG